MTSLIFPEKKYLYRQLIYLVLMAAKEEKKPKTVDEIVASYQKYHHNSGKAFKERINKWEEFHDPENIHLQQFMHHAHYTIFGKPTDTKGYPGAYNEAYKVLDKHVKEDGDKLEDEDKLAQILETYTDTFLEKAMGKRFKETIEHAKTEAKLNKKELRKLKGKMMSHYYFDERGQPIDILSDEYIQELKGKKKVELISELQEIGQRNTQTYVRRLRTSALDGLLTEEDHLSMAKYITPIFKDRGWKNKTAHITRTIQEQMQHYGALMTGDSKTLTKEGYTPTKYEKKKEEKEK